MRTPTNEPQRKRIRRKRPPQPVPVRKVRPMNILDVAPSEESAPGAPEAPDADTNAAEAPTEETGNVQAEAPPPEETGTAQPAAEVPSSSTGDQGWTAEEWELWTEAVKASNKKGSKGRKRKLQLYERCRWLKEQGLWKGTDPKPKYPGQG